MTHKNEVTLIANDNGYAAHKIAWYENNIIKTGKIPTAIEMGHTMTSTTGEKMDAYSIGESKYTCTDNSSQLLELRHSNYPLSPENRILFTHGLTKLGLTNGRINASVTLPYRDYYKEDGTINSDFVQKVAANFKMNNVVSEKLGKALDVVSVQVTPEAISAWFDWAMNDDGSMNDNYAEMNDCDGNVLVIDIGGSTTDIVSVSMVDGELIVRNEKSSSEKLGVLDAMEALHAVAKKEIEKAGIEGLSGHDGKLSQKAQTQLLTTGNIRVSGKKFDLSAQRDRVCADTAKAIINFIRKTTGSTVEYFSIIFVGGGSVVFKPWMEKMIANAEFFDEYANARGSLKFLKSQQG